MIWHNIANTAMQIGEFELAKRAYKISIAAGDGGVSLNNCGVLAALTGERGVASSLFKQAESAEQGWEALWNCALVAHEKVVSFCSADTQLHLKGDEQGAFSYVKKALDLNPDDRQARDLYDKLSKTFRLI